MENDQERSGDAVEYGGHREMSRVGRMHTMRLSDLVKERMGEDEELPVHLGLDESEDIVRTLWELVGHMGDDVGTQGYEFRLMERTRLLAEGLQAAILASIGRAGPQLLHALKSNRPARDADVPS